MTSENLVMTGKPSQLNFHATCPKNVKAQIILESSFINAGCHQLYVFKKYVVIAAPWFLKGVTSSRP